MLICKVRGKCVATIKNEKITGISFVILTRLNGSEGELLVAADPIGCHKGAIVLVVSGSAARLALNRTDAPIDLCVTAIVDNEESLVYD